MYGQQLHEKAAIFQGDKLLKEKLGWKLYPFERYLSPKYRASAVARYKKPKLIALFSKFLGKDELKMVYITF